MSNITPLFRKPLPRTYFYGSLGIIALNLFVYFLTEVNGGFQTLLGMNVRYVFEGGAWWQPLTYMYVHGDLNHILYNMLGLFFFGLAVEEHMGSWEFLAYYHLTGLAAGLTSLVIYSLTGQDYVNLIGASGAVFAVTLAFAAYRPQATILLFFVIPLRARTLVIGYAILEVFNQIIDPYGGVAHLTHLAGFVFGFLYLLVRLRLNAWDALRR